ncbi:hypothetical protein J4P02_09740 [Pseudomonas sp. NFXW11]|uniref:hypothetical protein n=1 Tax=Pseudomonas sp. NFXW11 TaxID=2819531 RepID=UPI003CED76F3
MSLSVGFSGSPTILINGKSPATIDALSSATAEQASEALGTDESGTLRVGSGKQAEKSGSDDSEQEAKSTHSIVVQMLLKRMKELQAQLKEQQQQMAAAQAANYSSPEAKQTAVMAIQGQISNTAGALAEVSGNLVKELEKETSSGAGNLLSTTV